MSPGSTSSGTRRGWSSSWLGTAATPRAAQRQSDDERAARLGLQGWQVVAFTYEDVVERPQYVVEMTRSYLAQRS